MELRKGFLTLLASPVHPFHTKQGSTRPHNLCDRSCQRYKGVKRHRATGPPWAGGSRDCRYDSQGGHGRAAPTGSTWRRPAHAILAGVYTEYE